MPLPQKQGGGGRRGTEPLVTGGLCRQPQRGVGGVTARGRGPGASQELEMASGPWHSCRGRVTVPQPRARGGDWLAHAPRGPCAGRALHPVTGSALDSGLCVQVQGSLRGRACRPGVTATPVQCPAPFWGSAAAGEDPRPPERLCPDVDAHPGSSGDAAGRAGCGPPEPRHGSRTAPSPWGPPRSPRMVGRLPSSSTSETKAGTSWRCSGSAELRAPRPLLEKTMRVTSLERTQGGWAPPPWRPRPGGGPRGGRRTPLGSTSHAPRRGGWC